MTASFCACMIIPEALALAGPLLIDQRCGHLVRRPTHVRRSASVKCPRFYFVPFGTVLPASAKQAPESTALGPGGRRRVSVAIGPGQGADPPVGIGDGGASPSPANRGRGRGRVPDSGQIGDGDGGASPSPGKSGTVPGTVPRADCRRVSSAAL